MYVNCSLPKKYLKQKHCIGIYIDNEKALKAYSDYTIIHTNYKGNIV